MSKGLKKGVGRLVASLWLGFYQVCEESVAALEDAEALDGLAVVPLHEVVVHVFRQLLYPILVTDFSI